MKNTLFAILIASLFWLTSCTTLVHGSRPGVLNYNEGYVILSTGRLRACDNCNANFAGLLPFVNWLVIDAADAEAPEALTVFRADKGGIGELGPGKYGYTHVEKLLSGSYWLIAREGTKTTPHFRFEVEAGKVSYLGEFLTVDGNLSLDSCIQRSDQLDRDSANILGRFPELEFYEFVSDVVENDA